MLNYHWLRHLTDLDFKCGNLESNCQANLLEVADILFIVSLPREMNTQSGETWYYESYHFCGNFGCLGKLWCMEWKFYNLVMELFKLIKFNFSR